MANLLTLPKTLPSKWPKGKQICKLLRKPCLKKAWSLRLSGISATPKGNVPTHLKMISHYNYYNYLDFMKKIQLKTLKFVMKYMLPMEDYDLITLLINGAEPLKKRVKTPHHLFSITPTIIPLVIVNKQDLVNVKKDEKGMIVWFDNQISWTESTHLSTILNK